MAQSNENRTITLMAPFENVTAKFARRKDVSGINNGGIKFFGARTRRDYRVGQEVKILNGFYLRKFGRSTAVSAAEQAKYTGFALACAWARTASRDLTTLTANQQRMVQVINNPSLTIGGYSFIGVTQSMYAFLASYGIRYYNDNGAVPSTNALPDPA